MSTRKVNPQRHPQGIGPENVRYVPRRAIRAMRPAPRRARQSDSDEPPPRPSSPAAALRRPALLPDLLGAPRVVMPALQQSKVGRLDTAFFHDELPRLNRSAGAVAPQAVTQTIARRLTAEELGVIASAAPAMSEMEATYLLCALGILASSIVRHYRLAADGDGLGNVAGLEDALLALARAHGRVPRDTYEIWTTGFGFTWTGTEGEARFGLAVREAERLLGEAAALIGAICEGRIALAESTGLLAEAAAAVLAYREVQASLATSPFPQEFLAMRNFLGSFTVGGRDWEGPNATYAARWNLLELAVGLLGSGFHREVRHRAQYMPLADRMLVEAACGYPSLCDLVADTLRLARGHWHLMTREEITVRVARLPANEASAVRAAARVAQAVAQLSAVHASVIRKNLTDPVSKMTEEEKRLQGVSAAVGVSKTPLEVTFERRDDRMRHALVEWIAKTKEV